MMLLCGMAIVTSLARCISVPGGVRNTQSWNMSNSQHGTDTTPKDA